MPRLTAKDKIAIRKDKSTHSITQLTEKYGVSKATVHRVLAGMGKDESVAEVNVPVMETTIDYEEFADVLAGKNVEPPPVKEKEKVDPVDDRATTRLAEGLFKEIEAEEMPRVQEEIAEMMEDPVKRTQVLQRIMLNLDNFSPLFTYIHDKTAFVTSLQSKSTLELEAILKTMEQTRTTLNLANQFKHTFFMVGRATEVLGSRFLQLKTDGFLNTLQQQDTELNMIFRELAIEYAPKFSFQTRPEMRLGMLYCMTLLQVDNTNRLKDYLTARSTASVPEGQAEKFADI